MNAESNRSNRFRAWRFRLVVGASALFLGGFSQNHASTAASAASTVRGQVTPAEGPAAPKRSRFGESALYVDGESVAVIRAPELPIALKTHKQKILGGETSRYLFGEYLRAFGVDPERVRAIHVYGGKRVSVVDGAEFRKWEGAFAFEFGQGDRGKPQVHFPSGMKMSTSVDMLSAVAVYVDKEPPTLHANGGTGYVAFADGKPIEGVPYAPSEQAKGTRVYVDGARKAIVKRKTLPSSLVVGEIVNGQSRFSLSGYLAFAGIDPRDVRAVDLLSGDDLVSHMTKEEWAANAKSLTFTLPARNQGQIVMDVAGADGARAKISAIQIFVGAAAPKRWIAPTAFVAISDEGAGGAGGGNGGSQDETL